MAGFLASNILQNLTKVWHWHDLAAIKESDGLLLHVRTKEEFKVNHIEGAINLPDTDLRQNLEKIPKDKPIYVYCQVGFRGYLSSRVLSQSGFTDVYNLSGGFKTFDYATKSAESIASTSTNISAKLAEQSAGTPPDDTNTSSGLKVIDASGLACPGPINALLQAMHKEGKQDIRIIATDPAFISTIKAYVEVNPGVQLISLKTANNKIITEVHKNADFKDTSPLGDKTPEIAEQSTKKHTPRWTSRNFRNYCGRTKKGNYHSTPPGVIIDVRELDEWKRGHLKQASLIPLGKLPTKVPELAQYRQKEIVTICASGKRSYLAAQLLEKAGFEYIRSVRGGMGAWLHAKYDYVK